jgi:formylglycine-generating enzyme required for sulfatase activity
LERRVVELLAAGVEPANPLMTNSIGMRFRLIPPGRFLMGAEDEAYDYEDADDERPRREVTLTRPFWVGVTPVTQRQYEAVMGSNPSHFAPGGAVRAVIEGLEVADFPVERVSWEDAQAFCGRLAAMPGESGRSYRLPSEAGWEYACRGGAASTTPFHFGGVLDDSSTQAKFWGEAPYGSERESTFLMRPSRVGSCLANAFGLQDMHGNVWEWCHDWYDEDYYATGPATDPLNEQSGGGKVLRGGSWDSGGSLCRAACRTATRQSTRESDIGFRVVLDWSP